MCADILTPASRSKLMAQIKGSNTKPELKVRKMFHRSGLRFRLHRKDLPGTPDLVFPRYKVCIFVHGCFWHRHSNCKYAYVPKSNLEFWSAKFRANVLRDERNILALRKLGWRVIEIWECETKCEEKLSQTITAICADLRSI